MASNIIPFNFFLSKDQVIRICECGAKRVLVRTRTTTPFYNRMGERHDVVDIIHVPTITHTDGFCDDCKRWIREQ